MVYGRPAEVEKNTICNKNLLRENHRADLSFFGRVGVDSNAHGMLADHLAAAGGDSWRVDVLGKVRGVIGKRESGRAGRHGHRHFRQ